MPTRQLTEVGARNGLLNTCQQLLASGLNKGTSGNVSMRFGDGFLITPSGVMVEDLTPESMVNVSMHGDFKGDLNPSSEWRFHLDLYLNRKEIHAVVHTHSTYATALSTLRKEVPPFHYMIAVAGGDTIRCAPYALFGSQLLSDHVVEAMQSRTACLLANHGMIAMGITLEKALYVAIEVESLCQQYIIAQQVGKPVLLTSVQMQAVRQAFKGYGTLSKK